MQHPILTVLRDAPEFRRMEDALSRSCGPVAAFGLQESHKAHIAAVLSLSHTVLLVSATDTGAARLWDSVRGYLPDASLFLPRETPLVHVMNASSERAGSRASALSSLLFRENRLVICSMGALLQRLAPRDVYVSQCVRLKTGDETSPRALVQRLAAAGYERVELVEGRGQVASRGDLVDVYPPDARYPIRVEFWGDTIDQMRDFDPITQRSVEQRTEALLPPAYETPQTEQAIARALRHAADKIGFETQVELWQQGLPAAGADAMLPLLYPKLDTLLDYLPESAVLVLDEPARLEEAAKTAEMTFAESVTAMLERGEGDAAQGKLQLGAEETLSLLNTPRTAACYALTRPHHAFPPKEIVQFLARPAPQYMGDTEELLRDVRLWKQTGEAALLFAGEHAKPLFEQLAAAGAEVAFSETLTRPPVRGEVLVTGDALLGSEDKLRANENSFDSVVAAQGYAYPLANFRELFSQDDYTTVNLESVLKDDSTDKLDGRLYNFRGPTSFVNILLAASVEHANIANNHYIDYGVSGRRSTRDTLQRAGIAYSGYTYTHIFEKDGVKIGFAGIRESMWHQNRATMTNEIKALKKAGCDYIVYACHWGTEYAENHNDIQKLMATYAIDAGADCVIGTHPHVVQGVEVYNGKPIFYSLGNFVFGGNLNPTDYDGLVVQLTLHFDHQVCDDVQARLIPILTSGVQDGTTNFQPVMAEGEEKDRILNRIQQDSPAEISEIMTF